MAYDVSKDQTFKEKIIEANGNEFKVSVVSYNNGQKKISILKQYDENKWTGKIGRIDKDIAIKLKETLDEFLIEL